MRKLGDVWGRIYQNAFKFTFLKGNTIINDGNDHTISVSLDSIPTSTATPGEI